MDNVHPRVSSPDTTRRPERWYLWYLPALHLYAPSTLPFVLCSHPACNMTKHLYTQPRNHSHAVANAVTKHLSGPLSTRASPFSFLSRQPVAGSFPEGVPYPEQRYNRPGYLGPFPPLPSTACNIYLQST